MLRYGPLPESQYNTPDMTDTIGQQLKRARKKRNLSLEQAAEATRIRQGYLQSLESDDYSAMPSPVHARGFLRNYAQYLELDLDEILAELRATQQPERPGAEPEVRFEGEQIAPEPAQAAAPPKLETESTAADSSEEPFWQTWLRRAKSEVGELDQEAEAVAKVEPEAPPPAAKPAAATAPEPVQEAEPGKTVETEAVKGESEVGKKTKPWVLLLGRVKSYFPKKKAKPAPEVKAVEEPEQRPEPEPKARTLTEPAQPSQGIMNEIGEQLRRRREMLSLSREEIERHTRLRTEIMSALEKGDFDELPSPVQTRGMLANYAGFLDLDVDALLLRYADALQARHRERHPAKPARRRGQPIIPENLPAFRTFIAGDVVFGVGMVLLLVGFSIWGISRVIALQSEQDTEVQVEATGPSISDALIGTPVETVEPEVTLIPAEDTPLPNLAEGEATLEVPTLPLTSNVQVNVVALERSFLRVTVDGEVAFEGRTIPGNAYPFEAEQSIEILAGNGSALRVIYNQRDMGLLGGFGQIASFIYTVDEVLVPTPEMSPTVTNTPFISPTPSVTPSPTLTPSPTSTPVDLPVDV